jgi:hypothetical protein
MTNVCDKEPIHLFIEEQLSLPELLNTKMTAIDGHFLF